MNNNNMLKIIIDTVDFYSYEKLLFLLLHLCLDLLVREQIKFEKTNDLSKIQEQIKDNFIIFISTINKKLLEFVLYNLTKIKILYNLPIINNVNNKLSRKEINIKLIKIINNCINIINNISKEQLYYWLISNMFEHDLEILPECFKLQAIIYRLLLRFNNN